MGDDSLDHTLPVMGGKGGRLSGDSDLLAHRRALLMRHRTGSMRR
jgi:hypothetical protein